MAATQRLIDFGKIASTLQKNRLLWLAPTILSTVFGTFYALTKSDKWVASQALIVRDEAVGEMGLSTGTPLGRFDSNDSLKRSLETLLQIAKHRQVVGAALEQVGPDKKVKNVAEWPTEKIIEDMQGEISVSSPKGTEFGSSEVIYLSVSSKQSDRAIALTGAVCDQLEKRMGDLRNDHAQSIIAELTQKKNLAERGLHEATLQLSMLEQELGSDLGEMRTLAEAGSAGESNLRSQVNQIKIELRQAESISDSQEEFLRFLKNVGNDAQSIVSMPNRLLATQPSLARLKNGLVDAQLRTARLRGNYTATHPRVQIAELNERNVEAQLGQEVESAIISTKAEQSLSRRLVASLNSKLSEVQSRLDRLAAQRAGYVNLISKVGQRREQLRLSSIALAEARGRQEAARASSLLTRLDEPFTGSRPAGPGGKILILGSMFGGLGLGLSLVYLIAPWQETKRGGRRADDTTGGRRAADFQDNTVAYPPPRQQPQALTYQPLPTVVARGNSSVPESDPRPTVSLAHLSEIANAD